MGVVAVVSCTRAALTTANGLFHFRMALSISCRETTRSDTAVAMTTRDCSKMRRALFTLLFREELPLTAFVRAVRSDPASVIKDEPDEATGARQSGPRPSSTGLSPPGAAVARPARRVCPKPERVHSGSFCSF